MGEEVTDVGSDDEMMASNNQQPRKHYGMGIGAFLQQLRHPENVFTSKTSKRNEAETVHSESRVPMQQFSSDAVINDLNDGRNVFPPRVCSLDFSFSNIREVYRERKSFAPKVVEYGFSVENLCNNYLKSCKWSNSSDLVSTTSQDRIARIFELDPVAATLKVRSSMPLGDLIYDSCWHPRSDWMATTSKDHPIHIWNSDGERLTTFRGINSLDELACAYSLCFTSDGSFLYAGYKSIIRKFDLDRPGRQVSEMTTWNKDSKGQKGILSCIAINPVLSSNYAVGSYAKTVGFYSDYSPGVECIFECQVAVTLLHYTPDGNFLLTAGRKDDDIICWDLRCPGKIYGLYRRPSTTNQRVYFDTDSSGHYLFSGSTTGDLHVFDLKSSNGDEPTPAFAKISAHRSALCGVSVHKERTIVATCSGQRVFPFPELNEVEIIDETGAYEDTNSPQLFDNSLALWNFLK